MIGWQEKGKMTDYTITVSSTASARKDATKNIRKVYEEYKNNIGDMAGTWFIMELWHAIERDLNG